MCIYHALINALSIHMIHINLNMIFYTHLEHSPTKTTPTKHHMKGQTKTPIHTHKVWKVGKYWTEKFVGTLMLKQYGYYFILQQEKKLFDWPDTWSTAVQLVWLARHLKYSCTVCLTGQTPKVQLYSLFDWLDTWSKFVWLARHLKYSCSLFDWLDTWSTAVQFVWLAGHLKYSLFDWPDTWSTTVVCLTGQTLEVQLYCLFDWEDT